MTTRGQGEGGEGEGAGGVAGKIRALVGRWPQVDADALLEDGGMMSDGLRDWDLWYVLTYSTYIKLATGVVRCADDLQGPTPVLLVAVILLVTQCERRPTRAGLQWSLCSHLDRRGCCYFSDQAIGRHHVCSLHDPREHIPANVRL